MVSILVEIVVEARPEDVWARLDGDVLTVERGIAKMKAVLESR